MRPWTRVTGLAFAALFGTGCPSSSTPEPSRPPPATPAQVEPAEATPAPPPSGEASPATESWLPSELQGWTRTDTVEHDLDGDGTLDLAVVLTGPEGDDMESNRQLVVALTRTTGLERVLASPCLAMCTTCGGVFGDPYAGLTQVGKRSLKVSNYGGSNWRWSDSTTLAWREGQLMVVGFDSTLEHTSQPDSQTSLSINLLSGKASIDEGPLVAHSLRPIRADDCAAMEALRAAKL